MSSLVADTHAALWYMADDPRLSPAATAAFDNAVAAGTPIFVPTICLVETTYLVERNRVERRIFDVIGSALRTEDGSLRPTPLTLEIAEHVRRIPRETVPDLPDRIIAATALALRLPLVTADRRIRALPIDTIW